MPVACMDADQGSSLDLPVNNADNVTFFNQIFQEMVQHQATSPVFPLEDDAAVIQNPDAISTCDRPDDKGENFSSFMDLLFFIIKNIGEYSTPDTSATLHDIRSSLTGDIQEDLHIIAEKFTDILQPADTGDEGMASRDTSFLPEQLRESLPASLIEKFEEIFTRNPQNSSQDYIPAAEGQGLETVAQEAGINVADFHGGMDSSRHRGAETRTDYIPGVSYARSSNLQETAGQLFQHINSHSEQKADMQTAASLFSGPANKESDNKGADTVKASSDRIKLTGGNGGKADMASVLLPAHDSEKTQLPPWNRPVTGIQDKPVIQPQTPVTNTSYNADTKMPHETGFREPGRASMVKMKQPHVTIDKQAVYAETVHDAGKHLMNQHPDGNAMANPDPYIAEDSKPSITAAFQPSSAPATVKNIETATDTSSIPADNGSTMEIYFSHGSSRDIGAGMGDSNTHDEKHHEKFAESAGQEIKKTKTFRSMAMADENNLFKEEYELSANKNPASTTVDIPTGPASIDADPDSISPKHSMDPHGPDTDNVAAESKSAGLSGPAAATLPTSSGRQSVTPVQHNIQNQHDLTVAAQLDHGITRAVTMNRTRAVLHLNPPELGSVTVRISLHGQHDMQAVFITDNPDTRQVIHASLDTLRGHLSSNGYSLVNVGIEAGNQEMFSRGEGNPEYQSPEFYQHNTADSEETSVASHQNKPWMPAADSGIHMII